MMEGSGMQCRYSFMDVFRDFVRTTGYKVPEDIYN
jgi:hypothetical protein